MSALYLLVVLLASPADSRAEWSCLHKNGRLMRCESPASCSAHYPSCVAPVEVTDPECLDPRCKYVSEPAVKPPHPEDLKKAPPAPAPPSPPKRTEWTMPRGPSAAELAAKRFSDMVATVRKARLREKPKGREKSASGLTAEQEAKLFGAKEPELDPPPVNYHETWRNFLSESERARITAELKKEPEVWEELRQRIASLPAKATPDEKDAAGILTVILGDSEPKEPR